MKIGLVPVNIGVINPGMIIGLVQLAEGLGYESVWTHEHVTVPVNYDSKYPYNKSGNMGAPPEAPFSLQRSPLQTAWTTLCGSWVLTR